MLGNWTFFLSEIQRYAGARVSIPGLIILLYTITPVVGGLMAVYHMLMKMQADDDREAAEHSRSVKHVIKVTVLSFCLVAVVHQLFELSRYSGPIKDPNTGQTNGRNILDYFKTDKSGIVPPADQNDETKTNCYFSGWRDDDGYKDYQNRCPGFAE